jgi:hypothetical protein
MRCHCLCSRGDLWFSWHYFLLEDWSAPLPATAIIAGSKMEENSRHSHVQWVGSD